MSNPAAPRIPQDSPRHDPPGQAGEGPDPDAPNPFGPDAPNVRSDDPTGGQVVPQAEAPTPPAIPLDDDDFAPDET